MSDAPQPDPALDDTEAAASAADVTAPPHAAADDDTLPIRVAAGEDEAPQATDAPSTGPAPERAFRRARAGIGLGTFAGLAVVASTSLGVGTHFALSTRTAPAATAATATTPVEAPTLPAATDLAPVKAQLTQLADEVDVARRQKLTALGDEMQRDLDAALPKLMNEVRVAREARLKKGMRKQLAGPFTADELDGVLAALNVEPGGSRMLLDRDGHVLAPKGAKLPEGVAAAASGSGSAHKVWTLGEGELRTLVARRCLVKERHCLMETRTAQVPAVDLTWALAALRQAADADAQLRRAIDDVVARQAPAAPAPSAELATTDPRLPVVAGGLAALLAALALGFVVRQRLLNASGAVTAYASAIAAGDDNATAPRRTAGELIGALDALVVLARQRADDRARAGTEEERRTRWRSWSTQLDRIAEGALDARLRPEGDASEAAVAEGINRVVAAFDQRVAQLHRHLAALSTDDKASDAQTTTAARGELKKRVDALRPITSLLGDIATRLKVLAGAAEEGGALRNDLARLSDAVASRAKTAQGLLHALDTDVDQLPQTAPAGGLNAAEREALQALTADLNALGVAPTLAHQMAADGGFAWAA